MTDEMIYQRLEIQRRNLVKALENLNHALSNVYDLTDKAKDEITKARQAANIEAKMFQEIINREASHV